MILKETLVNPQKGPSLEEIEIETDTTDYDEFLKE